MARKTFSAETKEQAVAEMSIGNLTQKEIADKFGCSVAALQVWRKELNNDSDSQKDWDEWEEEEEEEESAEQCGCSCTSKPAKQAHETMRKFWNKNYRGVDMLLTPSEVRSEEVVKLVNEAIQFACEQK